MKLPSGISYLVCFIAGLYILSNILLQTIGVTNDLEDYLTINVERGDSLWSYSEQYQEYHGLNLKDFVAWVEKHNSVNHQELQVGQSITLPIKKNAVVQEELLIVRN